jgi:hypothetical protein
MLKIHFPLSVAVAAAWLSSAAITRLVFKDGVGFDPAKLIQSVQGLVGQR